MDFLTSNPENKDLVHLDPRTLLILLVMANIIAFTFSVHWVEFSLIAIIAILQLCCGCVKTAIKWVTAFCVLVAVQYFLIPIMPKYLSVVFTILTVYARKIFPCFMLGALIFKTTPVRHFIIALRKWHVPQTLIIPLAITIRYFPAISEERRYIKDAMKLRNIKDIGKKMECKIVPLIMSATKTADELSAAAITRGIENPVKKTCVIDLRLHYYDWIAMIVGLIFVFISIFVGK